MKGSFPPLEICCLRRAFGSTLAVDDISFTVKRGQVFGYIGPNGAGKTTTMRIAATLDQADAGDARVDGFSATDDPEHVRRRLGFMPDYFDTYHHMNVVDYLDFFARGYGLVGRERHRQVARTLDFTGLLPLQGKPIDGLSKGMKQRLCLGRTMIHDPSVLILDEPAAGLDPRARIELREMIGQLAADGKAVLISSHILTELGEMCDQVGIIEQGRLLAVGSVSEISRAAQPHRVVSIRLLGDVAPLATWLQSRPGFTFTVEQGLIRAQHLGTEADEAALLRELIAANFAVVHFGSEQQSLEQVFMQVTQGKVQ